MLEYIYIYIYIESYHNQKVNLHLPGTQQLGMHGLGNLGSRAWRLRLRILRYVLGRMDYPIYLQKGSLFAPKEIGTKESAAALGADEAFEAMKGVHHNSALGLCIPRPTTQAQATFLRQLRLATAWVAEAKAKKLTPLEAHLDRTSFKACLNR